jgi:hypothetical protein
MSPELEAQIFTAIFLLIADKIDPQALAIIHELDMNDPRMVQHLAAHNQAEYNKLLQKYNPDGSVKAAAPAAAPVAPKATRLRGDGTPDVFDQTDATRKVHALFTQALSKKGGR